MNGRLCGELANSPMPALYVRVLEVRTDEQHDFINKLMVTVESESTQKQIRHAVTGRRLLRCDATWKFKLRAQPNGDIRIALTKRRVIGSDKEIGKCSLPLDWFPINQIVRDWFPLHEEKNEPEGQDARHWLLIDVHVNCRGNRQFSTSFSPLKVLSTWTRPPEPYAECPVPSTMVVVIQPEDPTGNQPPRCPPIERMVEPGVPGPYSAVDPPFYPSEQAMPSGSDAGARPIVPDT
jgi:hypothetical protein